MRVTAAALSAHLKFKDEVQKIEIFLVALHTQPSFSILCSHVFVKALSSC